MSYRTIYFFQTLSVLMESAMYNVQRWVMVQERKLNTLVVWERWCMMVDIAAPPWEWLRTPTYTPDIHATMFPRCLWFPCHLLLVCPAILCFCVVAWWQSSPLASSWNTVVSGEQGGWGRSGRARKRMYMGGCCAVVFILSAAIGYVRQGLHKVEDGGRTGELSITLTVITVWCINSKGCSPEKSEKSTPPIRSWECGCSY